MLVSWGIVLFTSIIASMGSFKLGITILSLRDGLDSAGSGSTPS
jgi:hypothetical protein